MKNIRYVMKDVKVITADGSLSGVGFTIFMLAAIIGMVAPYFVMM